MIDLTKYTETAFVQLMGSNPKVVQVLATAKNWDSVVKVIDSLKVKYTDKQLELFKIRRWEK